MISLKTRWTKLTVIGTNVPVGCSLTDDLGEIRKDLMEGINEYEAGFKNNASFEWRFGLDNHCGRHATDALRALHVLRAKGRDSKRQSL